MGTCNIHASWSSLVHGDLCGYVQRHREPRFRIHRQAGSGGAAKLWRSWIKQSDWQVSTRPSYSTCSGGDDQLEQKCIIRLRTWALPEPTPSYPPRAPSTFEPAWYQFEWASDMMLRGQQMNKRFRMGIEDEKRNNLGHAWWRAVYLVSVTSFAIPIPHAFLTATTRLIRDSECSLTAGNGNKNDLPDPVNAPYVYYPAYGLTYLSLPYGDQKLSHTVMFFVISAWRTDRAEGWIGHAINIERLR